MATQKRQLFHQDEDECKVDRISFLPDELLMMILCCLSFKEATATSILGSRWRYLHHSTRKLDLDRTGSLLGDGRLQPIQWSRTTPDDLAEKRLNYIQWVDDVIATRKSSTLDEFRVCFNLDRSNSETIDKWIRLALSRSIRSLELDFTEAGQRRRSFQYHYIFPNHFVHNEQFKLLKKLSTNNVNMSGEFVKDLFRNCRLLQHLTVSRCDIVDVEIVEPSTSFKCLEISMCFHLASLVIRDSSIVTLKVQAPRIIISRVVLENVPLLTEFHCWPDSFSVSMNDFRRMFSSVLPQLRLLKLYFLQRGIHHQKDLENFTNFCNGISFSNLKQLVVVDTGYRMPLPPLIKLMDSLPGLERFVLEIPLAFGQRENRNTKMEVTRNPDPNVPKKYSCLKEMEIVGYSGSHHEFEMIMHLVENGAALENIVVRTQRVTVRLDSWWDYIPPQKTSHEIITMAQKLREYLPSRINLEIL